MLHFLEFIKGFRHTNQMKGNGWTIRSTEWQIKGVKSARTSKHGSRDDSVQQQGATSTRTAKDRDN